MNPQPGTWSEPPYPLAPPAISDEGLLAPAKVPCTFGFVVKYEMLTIPLSKLHELQIDLPLLRFTRGVIVGSQGEKFKKHFPQIRRRNLQAIASHHQLFAVEFGRRSLAKESCQEMRFPALG